ncbi:unannotated protein [freshwater metagenome]|jgi:uncharacterized membrane protein|uniref:Unannotated protein n=1 Tax=freshwater metagenome TaxID=449393 RepID=A0A6J6I601_9ZZZZ|nr:polyketide cyclase / dehydrase and lipid transport [Actinomycetota bacterium]
MSELSTSTISIDAPLESVRAILFDLAGYPSWSTAIKSAEVKQSDDQGRATSVKVSIDAGMMKDRVLLNYDWSQAPERLEFSLEEADLLTAMNGAYITKAIDADTTSVTYELGVEVSMPIPAMMRTKAEKATIDQALAQLKAHAEE